MKRSKLLNYLPVAGMFFTLFTTIVYSTWFISGIEKRLTLQERSTTDILQKARDTEEYLKQANQQQDNSSLRAQSQMEIRITRIEDKIDRIYSLMLARNLKYYPETERGY